MALASPLRQSADVRSVKVGEARTVSPVMLWAALGVVFTLIPLYAMTAWVLSGDAVRTPRGPTPVGPAMGPALTIASIASFLFMLFVGYRWAVRPWLRERRLTLDGILCISSILIYWQDPLLNYFQVQATYNSAMWNLGSWVTHIPGWNSPTGGRVAEPLLVSPGWYVWVVFGGMVLGSAIMRAAKARWPRMSRLELAVVLFASFVVIDFVMELTFMRVGFYAYGGSISWLTIFHGHYFQFPIYEGLLWPACWTAFACVRYFTNDKGQTLAERGLENVRVSGGKRTLLRVLAVTGLLNVVYLVGYNIPIQPFGIHADTWPADIQKRSYFTSEVCGPGTTFACSGPGTPIPRKGSTHLDPNGALVAPGPE